MLPFAVTVDAYHLATPLGASQVPRTWGLCVYFLIYCSLPLLREGVCPSHSTEEKTEARSSTCLRYTLAASGVRM